MARGVLETAIFRFSNQDGDVIALHDAFLDGSAGSYVWWGWWKKQHEARREATLRELQALIRKEGRLKVALLNRKDEEYFLAEVDQLQFLQGGARGYAPDDRCPELYRDMDPGCPAWLRLRRIEAISKKTFISQFGEEPTGDPTLYEVRRDGGALIVLPAPSWDMRPVVAPGDTILHLSDVHFGSFHGYQQRAASSADSIRSIRLVERILETVGQSGRDVGVVVVSGDLVSRGESADFPLVADFLTELIDGLHLDKKHIVVVPGNHDFKTLEATDAAPTMDYSHERHYRDFLSSFFSWKSAELERLFHFVLSNGQHAVFGALNSARLRGRESKEYGYVGRHRYADMFDYMQQSLDRQGVSARRFAVLHHHLLPVQELDVPRDGVPISITVDAAELFVELQTRDFDAVLHGHQHRPFYFRGGRSVFQSPTSVDPPLRQLMVIGNGTVGASSVVPDFPFNCVGVHGVSEEDFDLAWFYFNGSVSPRRLASWGVPWQSPG